MNIAIKKIFAILAFILISAAIYGCGGGGGGQGGPLAAYSQAGGASPVSFSIKLCAPPSDPIETGAAVGSVEVVLFRGAYDSKNKYSVHTVYANYLDRRVSFDIFQGETYSVMVNAAVRSSVYDTMESVFSGTREIFIEKGSQVAANAQPPSFPIELVFVKRIEIFADYMDIRMKPPAVVEKNAPWPEFSVAFYDRFGAVLQCVNDSVEITALNGSLDGVRQVNARDGVAVFSGLSSSVTGKLRLSIKSEYFSIPEFAVYVKDPAGASVMSGIEFVSRPPALSARSLPEIVVRAFDQYGITYDNAAGTVLLSISSGTLSGPVEAYFNGGYAKFNGLYADFKGSAYLSAESGSFSAAGQPFSISFSVVGRSSAFVVSGSTLYCYDLFYGSDASSQVAVRSSLRWQKYFVWGLKKLKGCPLKNRLYALSGDNYIYDISELDSAEPRVNPVNFSQVGRIVDFSTSVSDLALYIAYESAEGRTYVTKYHRVNDPYFLRSVTQKYANIDFVYETGYNQVIARGAYSNGSSMLYALDFSEVPPFMGQRADALPLGPACVDRANGAILAFRPSSSEIYRAAYDTVSISLKKEAEIGIGEIDSILFLADAGAVKRLYHPSKYNNKIYCYDYNAGKKLTVVFNGSPLITPKAADLAWNAKALAVLGESGFIRLVDISDHSLMGDAYLYDSGGARLENTDQMVVY